MKIINYVPEELWNEVAKKCGYATFFHTYMWAKIMEKSFERWRIAAKAFILDDGTKAVLPLMERRHKKYKFLKYYESMPPGVYGGLISEKELKKEEINKIYETLVHLTGNKIIRIVRNPFVCYYLAFPHIHYPMFTQVLDLESCFEKLWKDFTKGHKSSARKAEKSGVRITLAGTMRDYEAYYEAYKDCVNRWGKKATSFYSLKLFENIFNFQSHHIKLWLAKLEGKVIGGALVFYWNKHVVWWHGASLEKYFSYCPAHLLQTEIIRDACNKGYKIYDFNPSGGHDGVVKFKQSFGTKRIDLDSYIICNNAMLQRVCQLKFFC